MATSLLLADDSPTIAKILGMALQSEDYEIRSALTADEAIKELRSNPPFFFLVDLTLPGKNGYEFARLIRSERKLKDVRILLLASAFDPADENEVKACGADGVITKPFDPGELRRRLREVRDAPPKFLSGDVSGSLSGSAVNTPPPFEAPAKASPGISSAPTTLAASSPDEPEVNLLDSDSHALDGSGDANSILSSTLSADEDQPPLPPEETPVFDLTDSGEGEDFTNATVLLDTSENTPSEPVLDLSNSFATPPRGTDLIDISRLDAPPPAPGTAPTASPADEPLSANAQALATFFAAEIDAKGTAAAPVPGEPDEDAFDASLSSIEWGSPKADLNDWSSAPPTKTTASNATSAPAREITREAPAPKREAPRETPAPKREVTHEISMETFSSFAAPDMAPERPAPAASRPSALPASSLHSGASSEGGSFLFDTGGSNFRFAEDYIHRITKAFTGNTDEMTFGKDASAPVFHKSSYDSPVAEEFKPASSPAPSSAPSPVDPLEAKAKHLPTGGGAWSPEEVKRIEQIVRDEVQMVVREIAEKVVWEVVPELAENLIRKELDKVLKEMEE